MKLGYYYMVTAGGAGSKEIIINRGDWTSVVDDERKLWQKYSVNGYSLAMTFTKDGLVLVVAKIIGGSRPDNNVSTWIFIPSKVKITGRKLEEVVAEIQNLYSNGTKDVTEDSFQLNPILGQDFEEKQYGLSVAPSYGNQFAYRSGNMDWTISEVLDKPFQNYYSQYKFVFLYKENPLITDGLIDLTSQDILDMYTVLPPTIDSIRRQFGNGNITIEVDGNKFTSPILRKNGSDLKMIAKRPGFLPIEFYGQVLYDEHEPDYHCQSKTGWRKVISGNMLQARDEKNGKVISAKLEILDPEWDNNTQTLPEERLNNIKIRLSYPGFETLERNVDFTQPISPIYLRKMEERKEYSCHTQDGRNLKIIIEGEGASGKYPLDGYVASNDKLIYKRQKSDYTPYDSTSPFIGEKPKKKRIFNGWNSWITYLLVVLAAIMISAGIVAYNNGFFSNFVGKNKQVENIESANVSGDAEDETTGNAAGIEEDEQKQNLERATHYIATCGNILNQDSLVLNPETTELFKDLNEFNLDELVGKWNNKFGEIPNFKKIVDAAKACISKGNDPKRGKKNGKYNKGNDTKINITNWSNWVDNECAKQDINNTTTSQTIPTSSVSGENTNESSRGNAFNNK